MGARGPELGGVGHAVTGKPARHPRLRQGHPFPAGRDASASPETSPASVRARRRRRPAAHRQRRNAGQGEGMPSRRHLHLRQNRLPAKPGKQDQDGGHRRGHGEHGGHRPSHQHDPVRGRRVLGMGVRGDAAKHRHSGRRAIGDHTVGAGLLPAAGHRRAGAIAADRAVEVERRKTPTWSARNSPTS